MYEIFATEICPDRYAWNLIQPSKCKELIAYTHSG